MGVNKPIFINSTGVKSKNTPLPGATAPSIVTTTARSTANQQKPSFNNSKGGINNNNPLPGATAPVRSTVTATITEKKPLYNNPKGGINNNTHLSGSTAPVSTTATATVTEKKPLFNNSKGGINNNTPFNPDAKVEIKKEEEITDVKGKIANTKTLFRRTLEDNTQVKAPTKTYLEGDIDVKYKAADEVEILKPVFQSKKARDESNFVDINNKEDVIIFLS